MSQAALDLIEEKRREAETVARIVGVAASTRGQENFNQIKQRNYNKSTYLRRHGLGRDDAQRSVTLSEFVVDFAADAFAAKSTGRLVTEFSLSLLKMVEENTLTKAKTKSAFEIQEEIDILLNEYRKALYLMNEDKAKEIAVKIRQLSNELVEATHMKSAFPAGRS